MRSKLAQREQVWAVLARHFDVAVGEIMGLGLEDGVVEEALMAFPARARMQLATAYLAHKNDGTVRP